MEASDLRKKSVEELNEELLALRKEQFGLRKAKWTNELSRNHEHRRVRRDIARIKTVLSEKARSAGEGE